MKAYKGFNKDMTCRGFQYKEGETYETDKAELCESGFHACLDPIDCFGYYAPGRSVFREVELDDVSEKRGDDSKIVAKKIKIGAEVSIAGIVKAHVEYVNEHIVDTKKVSNDKDYSAATNTGAYSAATNTGARSAATNTGDASAATNTGARSAATNTGAYSAATNTGDASAATNTGDASAATNTGAYSAATNTGDASAATNTGARSAATNTGAYSAATNTGARSAATNTGTYSAATNTGAYSAATNTGTYSAATNTGKGGVAIVTGYKSKAKGAVGSAICVCERGEWNGEEYPLLAIKAAIIDGEVLKADTFYTLVNGELVEAQEHE